MVEALGELCEVMVQYTSCADPTENAARKERLRQAEEAGQFEETAAQMVRSSIANPSLVQEGVTENTSIKRFPATLRLSNQVKAEALGGSGEFR